MSCRRRREARVDQRGQRVRDDDLLGQAQGEARETGRDVVQPVRAQLWQLVGDLPVAHDRARDELREHRDVRHERHRVAQCLPLAPVHVHDVGDVVERVERDADRQHQPHHGEAAAEQVREAVHLRRDETRVLPHEQRGQVERRSRRSAAHLRRPGRPCPSCPVPATVRPGSSPRSATAAAASSGRRRPRRTRGWRPRSRRCATVRGATSTAASTTGRKYHRNSGLANDILGLSRVGGSRADPSRADRTSVKSRWSGEPGR